MANELIIDKNNGILKLTMNRPDRRNALNQAMLDSLYDELIKAENDLLTSRLNYENVIGQLNNIENLLEYNLKAPVKETSS